MRVFKIVSLVFVILVFSGCASSFNTNSNSSKFDVMQENYKAADELLLSANLSSGSKIIMATVVNIDKIESSSTLGRLISEHIASQMVRKGMKVIEMKFRENVYMKRDEGELMLTREIGKIAKTHSADAVIVGTYALSDTVAYINLKIINPEDNVVITSYDYTLPMNRDISNMSGKITRFSY